MKTINRTSNRHPGATILKPIRLVGACVTFAAIALLIIYWMGSDEGERLSTENRLNNVVPETRKAERYIASADQKTFKLERVGTESVTKKSALPDELILWMSRSELDAFHERQTLNIEKQLVNPETKVELPPSDDILPPMTLQDLNALHRQQTIAFKSKHIEFVQPDGDGTNEGRDAVMTLAELDLIHKEQSIHARADNQLVELPPVTQGNELPPLTVDQLDEIISRQQLAADFNEVDDRKPIVLPPSSDEPLPLTNWGLIELHARQEKEAKQ